MYVNGAKCHYDVGAKMSTPIFFRGTKMSNAPLLQSQHYHIAKKDN